MNRIFMIKNESDGHSRADVQKLDNFFRDDEEGFEIQVIEELENGDVLIVLSDCACG